MTKFGHFGTILKVFEKILRVYLVFGKILMLLWQKCYAIGQVFIVADEKIIENNLAIWSHCPQLSFGTGTLMVNFLAKQK